MYYPEKLKGDYFSKFVKMQDNLVRPAYFTDEEIDINEVIKGKTINDLLTHVVKENTGSGHDEEYSIVYKRSRLDGVTLVNNIDQLRRVYARREDEMGEPLLNDTDKEVLENLTYDDIAIKLNDKTQFDFNAVLIYYTIYDQSGEVVLGTNLFGILFLDSPDNSVSSNSAEHTGTSLKFNLPTLRKIQSNSDRFGTSYSFKINIKTNDIYDDTSAYIQDNTTGEHLISEDFNDVLYNLRRSVDILTEESQTLQFVKSEYINMSGSVKKVMDDQEVIKKRLRDLMESKFGNLNVVSVTTNKDKGGYVRSHNIYGDFVGRDLDDPKDINKWQLNLKASPDSESGLTLIGNTAYTKYHDVMTESSYNNYQKLNYVTDTFNDISNTFAIDFLTALKIGSVALDNKDAYREDTALDYAHQEENYIKNEIIIDPSSFSSASKEFTYPYFLRYAESGNLNKIIQKSGVNTLTEINYVKLIPLIIKFLQSIDSSYLLTHSDMQITPYNGTGIEHDDTVTGDHFITKLDPDGTLLDVSDDPSMDNARRPIIEMTYRLGSLNMYVLYPIRKHKGSDDPDETNPSSDSLLVNIDKSKEYNAKTEKDFNENVRPDMWVYMDARKSLSNMDEYNNTMKEGEGLDKNLKKKFSVEYMNSIDGYNNPTFERGLYLKTCIYRSDAQEEKQ